MMKYIVVASYGLNHLPKGRTPPHYTIIISHSKQKVKKYLPYNKIKFMN